jgi:hypothetical protein
VANLVFLSKVKVLNTKMKKLFIPSIVDERLFSLFPILLRTDTILSLCNLITSVCCSVRQPLDGNSAIIFSNVG